MSDSKDKIKHSRRIQQDQNAVARQVKIMKGYGLKVEEPHKYAKHHALNCGDPQCSMCSNPRHSGHYGGQAAITQQERRLFQDLDKQRNTRSNGKNPDTTE